MKDTELLCSGQAANMLAPFILRTMSYRALLNLPESDRQDGTSHGLLLHKLLHLVHRTGSCHDAAHVDDVLGAHQADPRTVDEVRRHGERCPRANR